jgi:hypothetical protein
MLCCFFRIRIQNVALETNLNRQAVRQLRRLVYGFPLRRLGFEPVFSHMGFLVDKVATDPEVRVRFPALPDFLRSSGSGTGSIQPREYN